ncbi:hypothetical protein CCACVL1_00462 [Corchorus capsularis]|uniref:Uncharacterized protein n=1 Tax=Corchorus capsularis TaxID=210143 RepID=A0A1R3KWT1_COCAP|nr:hypothetical protein CCACVL1_00462 [Corchorus capsularis]
MGRQADQCSAHHWLKSEHEGSGNQKLGIGRKMRS